jgi:hypothetical protein
MSLKGQSSSTWISLYPNSAIRTGRYKLIAIIGAIASTTSYTLMILRWHGHTSFLESMYIIPGGFGNGIALSAMFVVLTAGIEHCEMAIGSSGLYLSSSVGMVAGISIASALLQGTLRNQLRISLEGIDGMQNVSVIRDLGVCRLIDVFRSSIDRYLILNMCDHWRGVWASLLQKRMLGAWDILMVCSFFHSCQLASASVLIRCRGFSFWLRGCSSCSTMH